jgi:hypothetical protein
LGYFHDPNDFQEWYALNRLASNNGSRDELSGNVAPMTGTRAERQREHELAEAHRIAKMGIWSWVRSTTAVTWPGNIYRIFHVDRGVPSPRYEGQCGLYTPDTLPNYSREDRIQDESFKWLRGAV